MSDGSDASTLLNTIKIVGACIVGALILATCVLGVYCWRSRGADDDDNQFAALEENLLRREDLEVSGDDNDKDAWQCVVCAYTNAKERTVCLMCGTNIAFLQSRKLARTTSSGSVLLANEDSVEDVEMGMLSRRRALFKRRLNSISQRESLSQRQRGAVRRRLWERKRMDDGKFHWVRQNSTDGVALAELAKPSGTFLSNDGKKPDLEVLHELKSKGFVCFYDDRGELAWQRADEISIDMTSFERDCGEKAKEDAIDFEVRRLSDATLILLQTDLVLFCYCVW